LTDVVRVELKCIYFNNVLNSEKHFEDIFCNLVKYISDLNNSISKKNVLNNSKSIWEKHLSRLDLNAEKSKQIIINAGTYFGYVVFIETYIYGPVNRHEIKNLTYQSIL